MIAEAKIEMKKALYNNQEYQKLLEDFDRLIRQLDSDPSATSKESVFHILQHFDVIHREPLTRLFDFLQTDHGELLEKFKQDYTIKTLMSLYDFIEDEIERDPLATKGTVGFVSEDTITLLSKPDTPD